MKKSGKPISFIVLVFFITIMSAVTSFGIEESTNTQYAGYGSSTGFMLLANNLYRITGYLKTDMSSTNQNVLTGFKVSVIRIGQSGTNYEVYNTTSDNNGYYKMEYIPGESGSYYIEITKNGYLKRIMNSGSAGSYMMFGTADAPITIWAGDILINGAQDNAVNMSDIMEISRSFNSSNNYGKYNSNCDLNIDNAVNMTDIMIAARHFNTIPNSYGVVYPVLDTEKPSTPVNLSYELNVGPSISLKWDPAVDNVSLQAYEIYFNNQLVATTANTNYVCTGLMKNTEYNIVVKAVDSAGIRSDASNAIKLTTSADDYGNTKETSTNIEFNKEVSGEIEEEGDIDYFKLVPLNTATYVLKSYGSLTYINYYLCDNQGNEKVVNSTEGASEFLLEKGKEYYIKAIGSYDVFFSTGNYRFIIGQKVAKPDLVVVGLGSNSGFIGTPIVFQISIENIGYAASNGRYRVVLDIDGQKSIIWADSLASISTDGYVNVPVTGGVNGLTSWTPTTSGVHTVSAYVDSDNKLDEICESNNNFTMSMYIDDYPDSNETAKEIQVGQEINGGLDYKGDQDYFCFTPKASGKYKFELLDAKSAILYLYDKSMSNIAVTKILVESDGTRIKSYVEAELAANVTYYISVESDYRYPSLIEKYRMISQKITL